MEGVYGGVGRDDARGLVRGGQMLSRFLNG